MMCFAFEDVSFTEEVLYWNASHRLNFSDFRGRPPVRAAKEAEPAGEGRIAGAIIKSIVADTRKWNGQVFFVVYASMKPGLSWIAGKGDSTALRHEQGHFDLCEIYARKLRREIGNAASVDDAKKMWARILDEEDKAQGHYDKVNTYLAGGITAAWKNEIRKQLNESKPWSRPAVRAVKLH